MKVSIIIPVYNVEDYILECLESVAHQTYKGDMECIIVDDCGTDRSISRAENFIQSYQGNTDFYILHHDHNRGLSAARNTGTDAAKGDYVYFLDADDCMIPETIEVMVGMVCKYPNVEMVQGGIVSKDGHVISDFSKMEIPEHTTDKMWIMRNVFLNLPVSSWNRLLRKEFLIRGNITFHEGIIHEDVPYCFLLSLKCQHIGFVKKNTYCYRQHRRNSILNTTDEKTSLYSRLPIMHDCINAYTPYLFESKEEQNLALKILWKKWLDYIGMHSYGTLLCYGKDIEDITVELVSLTPWPHKLIALLYNMMPLRVRRVICRQNCFISKL